MKALICLVLVEFEMRRWMKCERTNTALVGVNPDRNLLLHRAARHEDDRRLAEDFSHPLF
jgi:hypothetical protein